MNITLPGVHDLLSKLVSSEISVTGVVTATIGRMHVCSGTSADYTVTLPAASGNAGKLIGFRMAAGLTKLVTLDGNASETIDGALTRIMWAEESCILLCDGSTWFKIAGKSRPMFCVMRLGANQTGIVTGTLTTIALDTTDADNTGMMANSGSNRIEVKRPGAYQPVGTLIWSGIPIGRAITQVTKNSGFVVIANSEVTADGFPSIPAISISVPLVAGDYIQLRGYQGTGGNQAVVGAASPNSSSNLGLLESPSW